MNRTLQGVAIALAAAFALMMGLCTVLLARAALTPPAAAPVLSGEPSLPAQSEPDQAPAGARSTMQVSAQGVVHAQPDIAYITLGVQSEQSTAKKAQTANRDKMAALFAVLDQMGIDEADYVTTQYSVDPLYSYEGSRPRIRAYTTTNMVQVTLRDLDAVGALLDAAAEAGMNQAYSLRFALEDPNAARLDALTAAIANARAKAQAMAEAGGVAIVRTLSISDSEQAAATPDIYRNAYPMADEMSLATGESVPISSGTIEITVQAHITYEVRAGGE